jgi:hypothetical protein
MQGRIPAEGQLMVKYRRWHNFLAYKEQFSTSRQKPVHFSLVLIH